jgi:hypothetical protein
MSSFVCNGEPQPYEARVQVFFENHFHPGPAFANAFVLICDDNAPVCEQGEASRTVLAQRP